VGTRRQISRLSREQEGLWTLGLLLLPFLVLLGGAAYWAATWGVGIALAIRGVRGQAAFEARSPLVLGLAALTLFTLFQLVPVPRAGLAWMAARTVEFSADLPREASWLRVTLDPAATALEVAKWASYALVAALASKHAESYGIEGILGVVGLLGLGVGVISLGHLAIGAERVFGIYRPLVGQGVLGPLINPNHLASLENLATLSWLALWLGRGRASLPRALQIVGVTVCIVTSVVAASRGGVLALLISLVVVTGALLVRGRTGRASAVGGLLVGALGLGYFSLSDAALVDLTGKDLTKVTMLPELWPALLENLCVGVGRGAFGAVTQNYLGNSGGVVFRSIESFPVHWLVEWGAPFGIGALALVVWVLWPTRLRLRHSFRAGVAYVGVFAVLLQNSLDIGLELPGVAAPFWAVVGALEGSRQERGAPVSGTWSAPSWVSRSVGLLLPTLLGLGLTVSALWGPSVFEECLHVYSLTQDDDARALQERIQLDISRFPAEPYFWVLSAERARAQGEDALPFAAAALRRAPRSGRVHLLVAEALRQKGALHQALRHLAWAVSYDATLGGQVAGLASSWTSDISELELAVPKRNSSAFLIPLAGTVATPELAWARRTMIERAAAENPRDIRVHAALGTELLVDFAQKTEPCETSGRCPLRDPEKWARRIELEALTISKLDPASCTPARLRAGIMANRGNPVGADALLAEACPACVDAVSCFRDRIDLADQSGDEELIRSAEAIYGPLACTSDGLCARAYAWLGTRARARSEWASAARQFRLATQYEPTATHWFALADALAHLGELDAAEDALKEVRARGGNDGGLAAIIKEAREAALRRALSP
jgi:tetratricopeptide (TPR) repeat protein